MRKSRSFATLVVVALVATAFTFAAPTGPAAAASTTVVVGPQDLSVPPTPTTEWVSTNEFGAPGNVVLANGPGTPPLGSGSVRFQTPLGTDHATLAHGEAAYATLKFSQITQLQYSTYRSLPSGGNLAVALQLNVDYDTTDSTTAFQGRLVFEPLNTAAVPQNTWQTWNTLTGKWWMSGDARVGDVNVGRACPIGTPCTWASVLATYPNAGIRSVEPLIFLKAGSGWAGFDGHADALKIGFGGNDTTFDFENVCTTQCYVSDTAGSDSNAGTLGSPFKTIQKGINTVASGGTVTVAAGTYPAGATFTTKPVTLEGAGQASTFIQGSNVTNTFGLTLPANANGITIRDLTVKNWDVGIWAVTGPITNLGITDVTLTNSTRHGLYFQASPVTGFNVLRVNASNNGTLGTAGRGIFLINGLKSNVTVQDSTFNNNGLVGLDLSDGSATGVSIINNQVVGNGDAGLGVIGAVSGAPTVIAGNTVTDNGRFGIEVKHPAGDSTDVGNGSVTVRDNTVTRTTVPTDARDYAGIVIMRRLPIIAGTPAEPSGVVVRNNWVSGFQVTGGDGFGIVAGGLGHKVSKNAVLNNDVGVQVQGGNTKNVTGTPAFDRDESTNGHADINRNTIAGNTVGVRTVGTGTADATCNWWGNPSGPSGPGGAGTGDGITTGISHDPWLVTNDLNGACPVGAPFVNIAPSASKIEGNDGFSPVLVPVTLSAISPYPVTVPWATADGVGPTGAKAAEYDYVAASGSLTFDPGETTKNITVYVWSGPTRVDEEDETFTVSLSAPTFGALGPSTTSTITILNDDVPTVSVSAAPIEVPEGDAGGQLVVVTASLSWPSVRDVQVGFATQNGTAKVPGDYAPASGTLKFLPMQVASDAWVFVKGETKIEDFEEFSVKLSSPVIATLGNSTQVVRILNDDKPGLVLKAAKAVEGQPLEFVATLKQPYYTDITLTCVTAPVSVTATPGVDYNPTCADVVFPAGTTGPQQASVTTLTDGVSEKNEKLKVTLSGDVKKPATKPGVIKKNVT